MNYTYYDPCCYYYYPCCCKGEKGDPGPQGEPGPKGDKGDPGEPGPFQSCYLEALGTNQTVEDGDNFIFSIIDKVGNGIDLTVPSDTITISRPGLYSIEWSLNLASTNTTMAHVGLLQQGEETSFAASSTLTGNFASGALIHVSDVPYTLTLNNKSEGALIVEDLINTYSALSIRVMRFADAPNT